MQLILHLVLASSLLARSIQSSPLMARDTNLTRVEMTAESWASYGVDEWLSQYMEKNSLSKADLLHTFPQREGSGMDCSLDNPCRHIPVVHTDSPLDKIKAALVLSSLSHFNDLFRMFNRLYTWDVNEFYLDHRKNFRQMFSDAYSDFAFDINALNTSVPANDFAQALFTPLWYIPNAMPSKVLRDTVDSAIKECAANGFGYAWNQADDPPARGDQISNLQQSLQSAYLAWVHQYNDIVGGKGNISILDFIHGGDMLRMKYAAQLKSSRWHLQAYSMYRRQVMSMVFQANELIIHRASYDKMQPSDSGMSLEGLHDDPYDHVTYAFVSWGKDANGNLTRQYDPNKDTTTMSNPPSRVIYGQSWACFRDTNDERFARNYKKAWELPAYDNSLYISDWDGTSDGFDAHNPECTFNIPVNNQPANIKESWFMTQIRSACPNLIDLDEKDWMGVPTFEEYRAFQIASDAWVSTAVAVQQYTGADIPTQNKEFCIASATAVNNFFVNMTSELWSSFKMNLIMGGLFEIKDTALAVKWAYNTAGSFIRGGWSTTFAEGLPVVERPPVASEIHQGDLGPGSRDDHVENKPDHGSKPAPNNGDDVSEHPPDQSDDPSHPKSPKDKGDSSEKPSNDDHNDDDPPGTDDKGKSGDDGKSGSGNNNPADQQGDDAIASLDKKGEEILDSLGLKSQ